MWGLEVLNRDLCKRNFAHKTSPPLGQIISLRTSPKNRNYFFCWADTVFLRRYALRNEA